MIKVPNQELSLLTDAERAEALEIADLVRRVSREVLETGNTSIVYRTVDDLISRRETAEGSAALNAVIEQIRSDTADEFHQNEPSVAEVYRLGLEQNMLEMAYNAGSLISHTGVNPNQIA